MVVFKPFHPYIPLEPEAVAADPYDVVSVEDARRDIASRPDSFLNVDKPEAYRDDLSREEWGARARSEFDRLIERFEQHDLGFYAYRMTSRHGQQTGLVATFAVADYEAGRIKIHEFTRAQKEQERVDHVAATHAHTGPILLSHAPHVGLKQLLVRATDNPPLFSFTDAQGVRHEGFQLPSSDIGRVIMIGASIPALYIADGHHRAKAASIVAARQADHVNKQEVAHFLGVLFPSDELTILPYHRTLADVSAERFEAMLEGIRFSYDIMEQSDLPFPTEKGTFGIGYRRQFYRIRKRGTDDLLDVARLQRDILEPFFGVEDVRTDERLDFVGGMDSAERLRLALRQDDTVVFTCHATTMRELMDVADKAGQMPPKSTWFDPKLKSGLFIHRFD